MKNYQKPKAANFPPDEEIQGQRLSRLSDITARLHAFVPDYTKQEYEDFIRIFSNFLAKELACYNSIRLPGICTFKMQDTKGGTFPLDGEMRQYPSRKVLKIVKSRQLADLLKDLQDAKIPLERVISPKDPTALRRNVTIKTNDLT